MTPPIPTNEPRRISLPTETPKTTLPPSFSLRKQHRELTKHRLKNKQQILSELLTPPHIHSKCHANVESLVDILRDLRTDTNGVGVESSDGHINRDATSIGGSDGKKNNDKIDDTKNTTSFSDDEWYKIQNISPKASFPFMYNDNVRNGMSPLAKVQSVHRRCETYLHRAKDFRRRAHLIAKTLKEEEEADGNARDEDDTLLRRQQQPLSMSTSAIATAAAARQSREQLTQTQNEYLTRSKLQELNYRYCLGHGTCPQRTEILHRCWNQTTPELAKALLQVGRGGWICREEKLAVERCAGDLVQAVVHSSLQH